MKRARIRSHEIHSNTIGLFMSDTTVKGSPSVQVKHSNPAVSVLPNSAGQPITQVIVGGKVVSTHGQVAGTSVIHDNPA